MPAARMKELYYCDKLDTLSCLPCQTLQACLFTRRAWDLQDMFLWRVGRRFAPSLPHHTPQEEQDGRGAQADVVTWAYSTM